MISTLFDNLLIQNIMKKMTKPVVKAGDVLLAEPFMLDPNFRRSAVLLCEHNDQGSIGFILNKKLDMKVDRLIADFPEFDGFAFYGGPVQTDTIHYLHAHGDILEGSIKVCENIYWGGDFEQLKDHIRNGLITSDSIRFFVGYSGWSEGQLESELEWGSWVVGEMDEIYLYDLPPEALWTQILSDKGNVYSVIAQMPDEMVLN